MVEPLVLASTSKWRAAMLNRLGLRFTQVDSGFDELSVREATPEQAALVCALGKARAAAKTLDKGWVIGSDQIADLDGVRLHKPANAEEAAARLSELSGRWHALHTAVVLVSWWTLCLWHTYSPTCSLNAACPCLPQRPFLQAMWPRFL